MNFNPHYNLRGKHAILGASNYHWTNYSDEKLLTVVENMKKKQLGTELHQYAADAIKLGRKQPRNKDTVNSYINDCIGFGMTPEQPLYYSDYAFNTADAISFKDNFLRIHDLKTGSTPANIQQLRIYAAFFCLEYGYDPANIRMELRIYQNNEIIIENPDPEIIFSIMKLVVHFDELISDINMRGSNND